MENRVLLALVAVLVGGLAAGWYYLGNRDEQPLDLGRPQAAPAQEAKPAEPEVRYPMQTDADATRPLPSLMESDPAVNDSLGQLISKDALKRFFYPDLLIRRMVVTIDNLPRKKIPQMYSFARPVEGKFLATGGEGNMTIKPDNYRRYAVYVTLFEAIDIKKLVAAYAHFYPLLQEEYKNIGSPRQYFNDRVVEVIDHLLAAPDMHDAVRLVQPKVFYQFAEPALEDLSAGQKIMIRIGSANAARVKARLQEIRKEITAIR